MSGALAANPGMKQTTYVCETAHTGSNGCTDRHAVLAPDPIAMADLNANTAIDENMCGTLHVGGDAPTVCV